MSVITISRGTFSGGKALAECLSRRLGFRCLDRDVLVERAAAGRVSQQELRAALEEEPAFAGRFTHKRYIYLALIQAAVAEQVRAGRAIYHGLGGHLLLGNTPGILRVRVIAPLEYRIAMARERLALGRADAIAYIEKVDRDRSRWTRFLYGVDWEDAALYDFVVNIQHIGIEQACDIVAHMVEQGWFDMTPEAEARLDDLALASRLRAALALDPFTSNLEVEVAARAGAVTVKGDLFDEREEVERVAAAVPGVTGLTLEAPAASPA